MHSPLLRCISRSESCDGSCVQVILCFTRKATRGSKCSKPFILVGKKKKRQHFALHSVFMFFCFFFNVRSIVLLSSGGFCPPLGVGCGFGKEEMGEKVRGTRQAHTGTKRSTGPKRWRIRIACLCLVRAHQYK